MHKENKFQALYEVATLSQDNKGMMIGEPQEGPRRMTLMDIVDQHKKRQPDDNSKAPGVLPAPLSNNHLSVLADMYTAAANLQTDIKRASENPIIKDNNKLSEASSDLYKKLNKVRQLIQGMSEDLDKFTIEK
jgi:hypothetical protein